MREVFSSIVVAILMIGGIVFGAMGGTLLFHLVFVAICHILRWFFHLFTSSDVPDFLFQMCMVLWFIGLLLAMTAGMAGGFWAGVALSNRLVGTTKDAE